MNSAANPLTLDILVIAPHPDDAELGMGGAIVKFKEEGLRVGILDLTNGEPTPRGTPEIRARETTAATQILGVDWRDNLGLPNRSPNNLLGDGVDRNDKAFSTTFPYLAAPHQGYAHQHHRVGP